MNRQYREELPDGPTIGHGLKDGIVAEIGIGDETLQVLQLIGNVVQLVDHLQHTTANGPVQAFSDAPQLQGEIAEVEQIHGVFTQLKSVMIGLHKILLVNVPAGPEQIGEGLRGILRHRVWRHKPIKARHP
jgi:hypothetical protein